MTLQHFPRWSVVLLGIAVLAAAPAGAADPRPSPLDGDDRLAKKVDLRIVEAPLGELLERVSRETGTPLAVTEDTADERITVLARERSARELLSRVAEHLDYTWTAETRKGVKTLVLGQDAAARKREGALRGGAQRDLTVLQERVEELGRIIQSAEVRDLARTTRQSRVDRLGQIDERLHGRIVMERLGNETRFRRVVESKPSERERQALEREQRLIQAATPEGYGGFNPVDAAARVYLRLSEEQRTALWRGVPMPFAYPPERERVSLPAEAATALAAAGIGNLATRTDEAAGRDIAIPLHRTERVRGELWLERRGVEVRLRVRARMMGSFGDEQHSTRAERVFTDEVRTGRGDRPAEPFPRLSEAALALQEPVTIPAVPPTMPRGPENTPFSRVLEKLADRLPYPIVADGYASGVLAGQLVVDKKPLSEVLGRVCRIFDRTCRFEDGYLLLRHRDWATRRAMEPPARRVTEWEERITTVGALPFADLVEVGGGLTAEQIESLLSRWRDRIPGGAYWQLSDQLKRRGEMLRLLYSLPSGTRRSLELGRTVPVRSLPLASRLPLWNTLLAPLAKVGGYDNTGIGDNRFVPGVGFEAEDRLAAAWGQATLTQRRRPTVWLYTRDRYYPVERLAEALDAERPNNPKVTEQDLKRVEGEQIDVQLVLPGAEPVSYSFTATIAAPAETGKTR